MALCSKISCILLDLRGNHAVCCTILIYQYVLLPFVHERFSSLGARCRVLVSPCSKLLMFWKRGGCCVQLFSCNPCEGLLIRLHYSTTIFALCSIYNMVKCACQNLPESCLHVYCIGSGFGQAFALNFHVHKFEVHLRRYMKLYRKPRKRFRVSKSRSLCRGRRGGLLLVTTAGKPVEYLDLGERFGLMLWLGAIPCYIQIEHFVFPTSWSLDWTSSAQAKS